MNYGTCRFCDAPLEHTFCDLGMSPLSNSYVEPEDLLAMEPFYPLHALVCSECFLVQLGEFESPEHIFSDYAYFSSYSDSWVEHARRYTEMISARLGLGPDSRVIEVASNDGYLLRNFVRNGIPALGIEPAANVARAAQEKGIPTRVQFFGADTATELREEDLLADLIVGNNVLAHVPALNDFVAGLRIALKPRGVVTMEFPHLMRLIDENQFDTIYHEHFSYFSLMTVSRVFARHGLTIFDVDELPTHGGSLRIYARHEAATDMEVTERVEGLLERELQFGLAELDTYTSFGPRVEATKRALLEFLIHARGEGQRLVGYGAAAKGNTLLNYCGVRGDLLDYVVDRSPHKQGRYLPGTHLPIHSPERILETRPDWILILPWNLKEEITGQIGTARDWGGRFVAPIPQVSVLHHGEWVPWSPSPPRQRLVGAA